ncbi:MAG: DNA translocase FtsK 4TM domain-containing protein [Verrucomicrobiota bacterium]
MARAKTKTDDKTHVKFWHEVAAIFLFGLSILLLLALMSFKSGDVSFLKTPPNYPTQNWIGPAGAYSGFCLFSAFGLASYLWPPIMLGVAAILVFRPLHRIWLKILLALILVMTGAAFLQLVQPVFGSSLLNPIQGEFSNPKMLGGLSGYWINDKLLMRFTGSVGAAIILGLAHLISFILLFDIKPADVARDIWFSISEWHRAREAAKLATADPATRIAYQKKILEKKHRELRKKLVKEGILPMDADVEHIMNRPAPKVVDTTITSTRAKKDAPSPSPAVVNITTAKPIPAKIKKDAPPPPPSYENYQLPAIDLLSASRPDGRAMVTEEELRSQQQVLIDTLGQFDVEVSASDITRGATITRYEIFPAPGVRVERIISLQKDLARAMKAERVNILAPIPGKDTVGIEVPNSNKSLIVLRDLMESDEWRRTQARLPISLGKDVYGKVIIDDLADMPHLLIAGSTGSGKSVCINSILMSLLLRFSPDDLRIILIDPKVVELQVYNTLPHLVVPVVVDPKKVLLALRWVINEMEKRYRIMAKAGVRNVDAYNARPKESEKPNVEQLDLIDEIENGKEKKSDELTMPDRMPYIVVIIDELADLMQTAPADVENAIARLSAKARAAGIHLIIATQTPRASVITGVIKTNVPARIAFQVPSALDSRVILDENGAENLLGKGDLLYLRPGSSKLLRAQGAFVSEEEVTKVVSFITKQSGASYDLEIHEKINNSASDDENDFSEKDKELIRECLEIIRQEKRASTSLLQRRLKIGYGRAAWVIDQLEMRGIVGPKDGAKDREILKDLDQLEDFV